MLLGVPHMLMSTFPINSLTILVEFEAVIEHSTLY
jgi:hypothetical protein